MASKHNNPTAQLTFSLPKHQIPNHPGFEEVVLPNGKVAKIAYNKPFSASSTDLEIELELIKYYENHLNSTSYKVKSEAKKHLKFHYKKVVSLLSPKFAAGWNRWSDNILELFIDDKIYKILWGSGNCGKSAVMGILLYIKWRVNPTGRMIVLASTVLTDASARVWSYIKEVHKNAPPCSYVQIELSDTHINKGIFCLTMDKTTKKMVKDERACIIALPVKVDAKNEEIGANLLGKHPDDWITLAFDECQEIPASMLKNKIFANWLTNERMDVYAWGNPNPVNYVDNGSWDMLFDLGAGEMSYNQLKFRERKAEKTDSWTFGDTRVLRLSMLDSPKDDPDEVDCLVHYPDGTKRQRLSFLAGKGNIAKIKQKVAPGTPAWYSQVLGFPYISRNQAEGKSILSGALVTESRKYPLVWMPGTKLEYFMGVDPAVSGERDNASIVVGRIGVMDDGRRGVDLMNGEACIHVNTVDNEEFTDSIINAMYKLSKQYSIPLRNIAVETHGVGEIMRYALNKHIAEGKWSADYNRGEQFHIIEMTKAVTERILPLHVGSLRKANTIASTVVTEYWLAVKGLFLSRQIFRVPDFILTQFYNRYFISDKGASKLKIESKEQLRKRGVPSPNDADALCNMIELMRVKGGLAYKTMTRVRHKDDRANVLHEKKTQKAMSIVEKMLNLSDNFSPQNTKLKAIDVGGSI